MGTACSHLYSNLNQSFTRLLCSCIRLGHDLGNIYDNQCDILNKNSSPPKRRAESKQKDNSEAMSSFGFCLSFFSTSIHQRDAPRSRNCFLFVYRGNNNIAFDWECLFHSFGWLRSYWRSTFRFETFANLRRTRLYVVRSQFYFSKVARR